MKEFLLILIVSSILSCGESYEIAELYIQRIPNSSMVIYEYDAWSIYNDSNEFGYTIMDSSENVLVSRIKDLPIEHIIEIPTKNGVKAINLVNSKEKFNLTKEPIREYSIKKGEIKIDIQDREKFIGYSSVSYSSRDYKFDTFQETNDSLFFIGISRDKGINTSILMDSLGFKKGNIKLKTKRDSNELFEIEIRQLIEETGKMYRYKYGTNELEETLNDKYIYVSRIFSFKPNKPIWIDEFSDYGIYKLKK